MTDQTMTFQAIGTTWQIDLPLNASEHTRSDALWAIKERIAVFDQVYSRFRADSLVTLMSQKAGIYLLPPDALKLFAVYKKIYELTSGAVTPLIGQVLADAGYDATYSLKPKKLTVPKTWEQVMHYKAPTLTMHEPALLDFGAAGKGYLIDLVGECLKERGLEEFTIEAGGDILHYNKKSLEPLRVGLENPLNTNQVIGVATINNQSICGSAPNRRAWDHFHHIMHPKTLSPVKEILATWVIASDAITADALTTCLFFIGPEQLTPHFSFDYLIIKEDLSLERSSNFTAELFTA